MAFTIGQIVIWTTDGNTKTKSGTVTKTGKQYGEYCVWVDNQHKVEDFRLSSFLFADTPEAREFILRMIKQIARHKEENDTLFNDHFLLLNQQKRDNLR